MYLILADYLPYSYETSSTVGSSEGLETGLKQYAPRLTCNWRSETSREDLLNRLNNSNAWNKMLSSTYMARGITVKGGVDLLTWVASWNDNEYTTLYTDTNSFGYYVGTSENPTSTYCDVSSDDAGYENSLYFPQTNSGYSYYLTSKSASSSGYVVDVKEYGSLGCILYNGGETYTFMSCGVRPVVYLPSNIQVEKNAITGVWEIKLEQ